MNTIVDRINSLDISMFDAIESQTTDADKRSLLAVQKTVANRCGEYSYLEIGSHLGGSIQPHLLDARCRQIYSIDTRPSMQPDDRADGFVARYEDNSSQRMLDNLKQIGGGDIGKIQCIDLDASDVNPEDIAHSPQIIFIDGEHTKEAVLSDFRFCDKVKADNAVVLFHDFNFIYTAVLEICSQLRKQQQSFVSMKLEGNVFAIFFDPNLVYEDQYMRSLLKRSRLLRPLFGLMPYIKRCIPKALYTGMFNLAVRLLKSIEKRRSLAGR